MYPSLPETRSATSRAARASARNLGANASASDPPGPLDPAASSSLLLSDSDPLSMALDSDDPALSRSNSLPVGEDPIPSSNVRNEAHRRDKGKGRERDAVVRVKEEPSVVALGDAVPVRDPPPVLTRKLSLGCRPMKIIVRLVVLWVLWYTVTDAPERSTCGA